VLPTLETARAVLAPATESDVDALWSLFTDPVVRRFLWDDVVISREQAAATVASAAEQNARGLGLWTIRPRDDGSTAGCVALLPAGSAAEFDPRMQGGVEVLIALAPRAQHRGLATEALACAIAYAWRVLAVDALWASVDVPNEASHRAMLRAGFALLGETDGPRHRLRSYRLARPDPRK
jgi:ribosomal-protein-alanine N-acetyltransferase